MTSITAIICTRNRPRLLADCIEGLSANKPETTGLEMLIVDQSTDAASGRVVSMWAERDARVCHIPVDSVGLSRARNVGIARSSGEIVAFTDDDCVPAPNWAESIAREFNGNPEVAAVYGRSLPRTKVRPGERPVAVKASRQPRLFKGRANPWSLGHGCNMAFRHEVFDRVGLFDEALGPGGILRNCDDADFTYRLLRAGLAALYSPDVLVHHQQFRHGEDLWQLEKDYEIGAGALYSKHLRCGDIYVLKLILDRWLKAGVAHIIYGFLTGRRTHVRLGWHRIAYSLLGMWMARSLEVSNSRRVFIECPAGGES